MLTLDDVHAGSWGAAARVLLGELDWLEEFEASPRANPVALTELVLQSVSGKDEAWARARVDELLRMLEAPGVRQVLCHGGEASRVVEHDVPFARLIDGALQTGTIPRVVLTHDALGATVAAAVVGVAGDRVDSEEDARARAPGYRELVRAWRQATAEQWGIAPSVVSVTLLFLASGYAVEVA